MRATSRKGCGKRSTSLGTELVPDVGQEALGVRLDQLLDDLGRAVGATPGIDRGAARDGGGNNIRRGIGLAEIHHGRGGRAAGVGLGGAGQISAHKAAPDLAAHAPPERPGREPFHRGIVRRLQGFAQTFDDHLRRLGAGVAGVGRIHVADRRAVRKGIRERGWYCCRARRGRAGGGDGGWWRPAARQQKHNQRATEHLL